VIARSDAHGYLKTPRSRNLVACKSSMVAVISAFAEELLTTVNRH